jgi:hypothetical protein
MDLAPAWLCARECLDCTLQAAVRARGTRLVRQRQSVPGAASSAERTLVRRRVQAKTENDGLVCANVFDLGGVSNSGP